MTKATKDLNQLPALNGLFNHLIHITMVMGEPGHDYIQVCKIHFEIYVQAYRRSGKANTHKARAVGTL